MMIDSEIQITNKKVMIVLIVALIISVLTSVNMSYRAGVHKAGSELCYPIDLGYNHLTGKLTCYNKTEQELETTFVNVGGGLYD